MSFSERVEELDREIGAAVERAIGTLRRELNERLHSGHQQLLRSLDEVKTDLPSRLLTDDHVAPIAREATGTARQGAFAELRDAVVEIDSARSQAAILSALLAGGRRFASRTAVLILKNGQLQGWGAQGFGDGERDGDQAIRGLSIADGAWGRLGRGDGTVRLAAAECADLCSRLESPLPQDAVLVPLVLRDQVAAALYADHLDGADLLVEGVQTLAYVASQAIESLPFRERAATSTLRVAEPAEPAGTASAAAAPSAAPPATAERADTEPPAVPPALPPALPSAAIETAVEEPAHETADRAAHETEHEADLDQDAALDDTAATASAAHDATPAASLAPAAEPAAPSAWVRTQEVSRPEEAAPRAPAPAPAAAAETVLMPRIAFTEPAETPAPAEPAAIAELGDDTQVGAPRAVSPAPAPAPPPAAVRDEPRTAAAAASGNPEVRPPSDVQGPGWAFATTRVNVAADDEALHEEARRLARLLVSEIKLYNEEQVEEGRRNRDLYERLKDDIDRSRQMYEERVEPRVLRTTDYFYQELVRILAAGDSKALGI